MKAGPAFTVPLEQSSSWGCGPQRFLPSCRVSPGSKALRPSLWAGARWGQTAACPKTAPPESVVLSSLHLPFAIPLGCHMDAFLCQLVWSNPNCYYSKALERQEGERHRVWHFLAAIGKTARNWKKKMQMVLHSQVTYRSSRRKGNVQTHCSSQDCLSKQVAALAENCSTRA